MSTRTIKLKVLTATNVVTIVTNARTFGEFKTLSEVKELGIDWSSAKLIDRATKASFELDDAVLPSVDCVLFHSPTKSKAGINWDDAGYKECKAEVKKLKEGGVIVDFNYTQASTETLRKFLVKYYKKLAKAELKVAKQDDVIIPEDEVSIIVSEIEYLFSKLKEAVANVATTKTPEIEYVIGGVTIEDLEAEFAEIKKQLK